MSKVSETLSQNLQIARNKYQSLQNKKNSYKNTEMLERLKTRVDSMDDVITRMTELGVTEKQFDSIVGKLKSEFVTKHRDLDLETLEQRIL